MGPAGSHPAGPTTSYISLGGFCSVTVPWFWHRAAIESRGYDRGWNAGYQAGQAGQATEPYLQASADAPFRVGDNAAPDLPPVDVPVVACACAACERQRHGRVAETPLTDDDWRAAKAHFDDVKQQYADLLGHPRVNVVPALRLTFEPLERRYNSGERTRALYDEMRSVE